MFRELEKSNFWFVDGTFKVIPKTLYHLYSMHVNLSGIAPACIYASLQNKTGKTRHRFLGALKNLTPDGKLEKVLLEFEQATFQTFR